MQGEKSSTFCVQGIDIAPEELISNIETACNQLDITGILDCVTPSKAAPAKAMVKKVM